MHAVVNQQGEVLATFPTCEEAVAYCNRHARMFVRYTISGKRPEADMHAVRLDRLEHYRQQLKEATA